jgi:CrcB protein
VPDILIGRAMSIQQEVPSPRRWRHLAGHDLVTIFLGGALGSIVRTALAKGFPIAPGAWPWPTFAVNILGAAVLGYLIARTQEARPPTMYGRSFVGIGFCGALTTFSTVMIELLGMLESSRWGLAVGYGLASIAAGLAAVLIASRLARRGLSK